MAYRNIHRSLSSVAVIDAWFSASAEDARRLSLHANLVFREERLGGGSESTVCFTVAIKKCDVVAVLPLCESIRIDGKSLRRTAPKQVTVTERKREEKSRRAKASGSVGLLAPKATVNGEYETTVAGSTEQESVREVFNFSELHGRVRDGSPCWSIWSESGQSLHGSLWNIDEDVLLTLVDGRDAEVIKRENEKFMGPYATIQVRCLREDIEIKDLRYKDEEMHQGFLRFKGSKAKLAAAEAYIKHTLTQEGLICGDMKDIFAELALAEMTVPVYEQPL